MTVGASCRQLATMRVFMAVRALSERNRLEPRDEPPLRVREDAKPRGQVALVAGHVGVFARERKVGTVMIELGRRLPRGGTRRTLSPGPASRRSPCAARVRPRDRRGISSYGSPHTSPARVSLPAPSRPADGRNARVSLPARRSTENPRPRDRGG